MGDSYRAPNETEVNALNKVTASVNIPVGDSRIQLKWTGSGFAVVAVPGSGITGLPAEQDGVKVLSPTEAEFKKLTSLEGWAKILYRGGPIASAMTVRYLFKRNWVTFAGLLVGGYLSVSRLGD